MTELDQNLLRRARRAPRKDEVSEDERIAMNILWRDGVRVPILTQIFRCSRSTIYYNCLTGYGEPTARAAEINAEIDRMGEAKARAKFVKEWMIDAVNTLNAELAKSYSAQQ